MAQNKKISELELATQLHDACCFPLVNEGETKRVEFATLKDAILEDVPTPSIIVDSEMSNSSTNPVENKVIKAYVDNKPGATVDDAMSDSSENAVQNKVIKAYVDSASQGSYRMMTQASNIPQWESDNTYAAEGFIYRGSISFQDVTDSMYAEVTFSPAQVLSGDYAPVCETGNGVVYVYSKVNTAIIIPMIKVEYTL